MADDNGNKKENQPKVKPALFKKKRFSLKRLVMLSAPIVLPPRYISIIFTRSFSHDTCTCNNKLSAILSTLCLILFLIHVHITPEFREHFMDFLTSWYYKRKCWIQCIASSYIKKCLRPIDTIKIAKAINQMRK